MKKYPGANNFFPGEAGVSPSRQYSRIDSRVEVGRWLRLTSWQFNGKNYIIYILFRYLISVIFLIIVCAIGGFSCSQVVRRPCVPGLLTKPSM